MRTRMRPVAGATRSAWWLWHGGDELDFLWRRFPSTPETRSVLWQRHREHQRRRQHDPGSLGRSTIPHRCEPLRSISLPGLPGDCRFLAAAGHALPGGRLVDHIFGPAHQRKHELMERDPAEFATLSTE